MAITRKWHSCTCIYGSFFFVVFTVEKRPSITFIVLKGWHTEQSIFAWRLWIYLHPKAPDLITRIRRFKGRSLFFIRHTERWRSFKLIGEKNLFAGLQNLKTVRIHLLIFVNLWLPLWMIQLIEYTKVNYKHDDTLWKLIYFTLYKCNNNAITCMIFWIIEIFSEKIQYYWVLHWPFR